MAQVAAEDDDPAALPRALSDALLSCLAHKFARLILVALSVSINRLMTDYRPRRALSSWWRFPRT